MNFDRLRFVAERAELGERREAIFAVTIPEEPGSLRKFCNCIGRRNLTEFNYRIADDQEAHIFVGVQIQNRADAAKMVETFEKSGFKTLDLTDDELTKMHLRHMVGGHSSLARNELLYRFEFPERPGALMQFVGSMIFAGELKGEYRKKTTPVGSFPPNAFGLYDLHGSVGEWCADPWHQNYKGVPRDGSVWDNDDYFYCVMRGGSWRYFPRYCRSAYRNYFKPDDRRNNFGFRIARSAPRTL